MGDEVGRILAGSLGWILICLAAHGAVVLYGGYLQPAAWGTIVLALGTVLGAVAIGRAVALGRNLIAGAVALTLVVGQAHALTNTSSRINAARETAEAARRDAEQKHARANERLAAAQEDLRKADTMPIASEREAKAQAAMDAAVAKIREQASVPSCKDPCMRALSSAAADTRAELEAAQAENAQAKSERRDAAARAVSEAESAVRSASEAMPQATAGSGLSYWPTESLPAALLALALNGSGSVLIALSAYGRRPTLTRVSPAPRRTMANAQVTGRVSQYIAESLQSAESGRIAVDELHRSYAAWCRASDYQALEFHEFNDQLREPLDSAGIRLRPVRDKIYLVGVALK